jgi:GNAT superfamily N-acetyltransferase
VLTGPVPNSPVLIRARRDADLNACADLVREVHSRDRYPRFLPADIARFLNPPDQFGCWIADLNGEVAGHVALVARGLPATMEIAASALGRPADELAVVARLFVSPRARGRGAGRLLLNAATAEARSRGLHPVLDVDIELPAAIALYESAGWTRAGQLTVRWPDHESARRTSDGQDAVRQPVERVLTEYVYLGPHPD